MPKVHESDEKYEIFVTLITAKSSPCAPSTQVCQNCLMNSVLIIHPTCEQFTGMELKVKSPLANISEFKDSARDSIDGHLEDGDSSCHVCENYDKTIMIFDSIALQFSVRVFFRQLLAHTVIIFAPFVTNVTAQGFTKNIQNEIMPIVYNIVFPLILYLMLISYFMCPAQDKRILAGAFLIPLIYFIQHKLIVALKYASLSDTEYLRFMTCKDYKITQIYQSQMQLIAAWLNREENVLEFELGAAAARVGAKINEIAIIVQGSACNGPVLCVFNYFFSTIVCVLDPNQSESSQSQFRNWNAFLRSAVRISLINVCDSDCVNVSQGSRHDRRDI